LDFLQGQFTQELQKLESGHAAYGFWLTQKGKILGDSLVRPISAERCIIGSWSMSAADLMQRLEDYIIADDVELEDQTDIWQGWWISSAELNLSRIADFAGAHVLVWSADPVCLRGCLMAPSTPSWPPEWTECDPAEIEQLRIAAKWPRAPIDLTPEDTPHEAGVQGLGVSFTKGCYLGQEVVARLQATGRVRRTLRSVTGRGRAPVGKLESLRQGDKEVGQLRSRVALAEGGWIGLAMVSLARVDLSQAAEIGETGNFVRFEPEQSARE